MLTMKLGPYEIGDGQPPLVIAEAGINHHGSLELALRMVEVAAEKGAHIVKFQTHLAEAEMLPDQLESEADAGSHVTSSLYSIMDRCQLSLSDHLALKEKAHQLGLMFLSTPFSVEAVDLLEEVGVDAYKVGSGEVNTWPFLDYVASKGKPMIVSTGTADWDETAAMVEMLKPKVPGLVVLQCTSNYPTPYPEVNLGVMDRLRNELGVLSGLSDHCPDNYACFAAAARGACLVEKHFTLSRMLPGIDQPSSIEPRQLADLVKGVKAVAECLGDRKQVNEEAAKVRMGFSQSLVTTKPVAAGEALMAGDNLWYKRPGSGMSPNMLPEVDGKKASRDLPLGHTLAPEDFQE